MYIYICIYIYISIYIYTHYYILTSSFDGPLAQGYPGHRDLHGRAHSTAQGDPRSSRDPRFASCGNLGRNPWENHREREKSIGEL